MLSEVVRDPGRLFLCRRCGRPMTYRGRGRRPVWCSARCRVEASIERRGNRIVGVEPRVVTVVPPTKRLSQWEQSRRQQIEESLNQDPVIGMVAHEPHLLVKVVERLEAEGWNGSDVARHNVAQRLAGAARALAPDSIELARSAAERPRKRGAADWARLLEELSAQLASGQFCNRDLPVIEQPLSGLIERYLRRRG